MTQEEKQKQFIAKAIAKYGEKFDYSKVNYTDFKTRVCIICPEHGEFWQTPRKHLSKEVKCGCPTCGCESQRKTTEQFIKDARKVHGEKYDYSKVNYINAITKVCIICPIHGKFYQTPIVHLNNHGCPSCGGNEKVTLNTFIKRAEALYGDRYDYSQAVYKDTTHGVTIFDNLNQCFFIQTPQNHLKGKHYNMNNVYEWYRENGREYDYYYNIAKQYNDIFDLYNNHTRAFRFMKKKNWLKDYTWLKNNLEIKVKQSVVYAYEFPDNAVYVGLTISLPRRDEQHRTRRFHSNGKPQYDGVLDYAEANNLEIPEPKVLSENLTRDESGKEERKWIKKYRNDGWRLINKNGGGSTGSNIIKSRWTDETIINEAKKYKTMSDMRNHSRSAYNYMIYHGLKETCFPNAKFQIQNPDKIYTKELIEETVKKCPHKTDLRNLDMPMYQYLFRHKLLYDYYPVGNYTHKNYQG